MVHKTKLEEEIAKRGLEVEVDSCWSPYCQLLTDHKDNPLYFESQDSFQGLTIKKVVNFELGGFESMVSHKILLSNDLCSVILSITLFEF